VHDYLRVDADLVLAARRGDQRAFGQLVERYQSLTCALAYGFVGDLGESEEIAQEAFVRAWKELPALREPDRFRNWLCAITKSVCLRSVERRGNRKGMLPTLDDADVPSTAPSPLDAAISREEEHLLWRALGKISETYRIPLILYYSEHQSIERVADALALSQKSVKMRLSRGRRLLEARVTAMLAAAMNRSRRRRKEFTAAVIAAFAGTNAEAMPELGAPKVARWKGALTAISVSALMLPVLLVGFGSVARDGSLSESAAQPGTASTRRADNRPISAPPQLASSILPRTGSSPSADQKAVSLYAYDFEDGLTPAGFRHGWIADCPPGNQSRHCLIGTVSPGWGLLQGVTLTTQSTDPCAFLEAGKAVSISFDYWMGQDRSLLIASLWSASRNASFQWETTEVVQERWGHAQVRMADFKAKKPEHPDLETGDSVCFLTLRAGRAAGKPFYIDNIRIIDHHVPESLPGSSLANIALAR
jgi:RNA polymerase sigma factor (sigma-70 family)